MSLDRLHPKCSKRQYLAAKGCLDEADGKKSLAFIKALCFGEHFTCAFSL